MKITPNVCLRGVLYVRTIGRIVSRRGIYWLSGVFLSFCISPAVEAVPPLVPATDVAQPNLQAWWRPGDFIVGVDGSPGQPAMRPLVNVTPMVLPIDISNYEKLGVECQDDVRAEGEFGGQPIAGSIAGDPMNPQIQITREGRLIAENTLGRPASICEIRIVQADHVPGLELIVAWKIDAESSPIHGFTVYRIPEALDPTPQRQPK
jgi:hypothetical protein